MQNKNLGQLGSILAVNNRKLINNVIVCEFLDAFHFWDTVAKRRDSFCDGDYQKISVETSHQMSRYVECT